MRLLSFRITPWSDEKSAKSTGYVNNISHLGLEMRVLGQPPIPSSGWEQIIEIGADKIN